ncbi:hypothetical protein [Actinomycetospora sp. CA-053990]|uniref:hypothetical protein n=1 Tax=Actinomycetospora sp. CA-053990 TaxID=3239891 RepID=UPI003D91D044
MLKKMGVVTVGVAAGLMVAAPFASATESGHDGHGKHHGESSDCNVTGGSSAANGGIDGNAFLGNAVVQAPVGGANVLNVVCNDILNGNLSGNNVAVSVLGEEAEAPTPDVEAPEAPEAPVDPVIFDVL